MENIAQYFARPTQQDFLRMGLVFLFYFLFAKFGLYIFYTFNTSPALIWPPVGIAVVAMIFGGYRMSLPIFLAQFLAVVTRSPAAYEIALIIAAGYALQSMAILYALRHFKFDSSMSKLRDVVMLVIAAFILTLIEPTIATVAQMTLYTLSVSPLVNLGRAWGAGIFSILVIAPFAFTWYPWKHNVFRLPKRECVELGAAFTLLFGMNYFLFWTPYPQYFGISVIFFLPLVLIWFSLRLHPRWLTLALLLTSIHGIAGSIIAHPSVVHLNEQLLADEIYIGLVAAIFLVFVATVEDRRTAHRKLEEAYKSTSQSDKAKGDFIAILAHELRNPLAPIVSSLELLTFQPQTPESLRLISNTQKHIDMIRRLLDDLLDTARLTQNKFKLQKETVKLREIVEESIASIQNLADSRQHVLRITLPKNETTLFADPVRIKQIIINLLSNACKYTPPKGNIQLTAERKGDHLILRVSDNGIGIAPDMLDHIFEPFEQLNASKPNNVGLGIGLFLTKQLVTMHDGKIEATSKGSGKGSTFTVALPLGKQAPFDQKQNIDKEHATNVRRILVVDDNEAAANSLQKLLTHHGHTAEVAYSGKHALDILSVFNPEVMLLDIGMPDMDGYELARLIRKTGWTGTLMALTGYGQDADRLKAKEAKFNHHLVKPVSIVHLTALLEDAKA